MYWSFLLKCWRVTLYFWGYMKGPWYFLFFVFIGEGTLASETSAHWKRAWWIWVYTSTFYCLSTGFACGEILVMNFFFLICVWTSCAIYKQTKSRSQYFSKLLSSARTYVQRNEIVYLSNRDPYRSCNEQNLNIPTRNITLQAAVNILNRRQNDVPASTTSHRRLRPHSVALSPSLEKLEPMDTIFVKFVQEGGPADAAGLHVGKKSAFSGRLKCSTPFVLCHDVYLIASGVFLTAGSPSGL